MSINNGNFLPISEFHKICRTCTSKTNLQPLYDNIYFVEMLQFCTMIQFDKNDNLPAQICQSCISELLQAYKFTRKCKTIDTALKKCITELEQSKSNIKIEINMPAKFETKVNNINETKSNIEVINVNTCENKALEQNIEAVYIKDEPPDADFEDEGCNKLEGETNSTSDFKKEDKPLLPNTEEKESSFQGQTDKKTEKIKKYYYKPHNDERRFKCDICQKRFNYLEHLKKHKRIHTGEKPYACSQCNKKFSQLSSLTKHYRIHTGERPYKCDICQKCFNQSGTLVTHKRLHSGEKPFSCNFCDKAFTTSSLLIAHRRVHTGERPFRCDMCPKSFITSSHLNKHKDMHLKKKELSSN